jgi:hypothetical protein
VALHNIKAMASVMMLITMVDAVGMEGIVVVLLANQIK